MTLAGGCGAGSIWRAGEGQVKLWAAIACFALGASLTRLAAAQTGLLQQLGAAALLPSAVGCGGAARLLARRLAGLGLRGGGHEEDRRVRARRARARGG